MSYPSSEINRRAAQKEEIKQMGPQYNEAKQIL